jgi:hypothetical protein
MEELERLYLLYNKGSDLNFRKDRYKEDKECYVIFLKGRLMDKNIDILDMYASGDRFMVIKATYEGKEISSIDKKYISCWYVDIYSEKTKKTYRVLSI